MLPKPYFYWSIPLLTAVIVAAAVLLIDLQITAFRNSYFTALQAETRQSDALTVELFKAFLEGGNPEKLRQFLDKRAGDPLIVQIKAPGGVTVMETPDAPHYLREHLQRPHVREFMRGAAPDEVVLLYSNYYHAWFVYHSVRFMVQDREYILLKAERCDSVSRIIHLAMFAMLSLSLLGALLVAGLLLYFFRRLRSPLRRLQNSTRQIAAGDLDCAVYVPNSGVVRDIALDVQALAAHLKQQILELRKLENCRGEFVAAISHAMKTPVTAILSAVEGIENGALEEPEYRAECIKALRLQSQRLAGLLYDFLSLTALELQELKPEQDFMPLSLTALLQNAAAAFRDANPGVEVTLTAETDGEMPGDPHLLQQAVHNLLQNAVQHGGAGRIDLTLTASGAGLRLMVRDNGCGIAAEHLPRIFDRFYRMAGKKHRPEPGNGLGLAIVKHIVALHQGEIRVQSTPGAGTEFLIEFYPRNSPMRAAMASPASSSK